MNLGQIELGKTVTTVGCLTGDIKARKNFKEIDVFELRIDLFKNQEIKHIVKVANSIRKRFKKPLICTVRSSGEGSPQIINDEKRYEIIKGVISIVEAIDIELSSNNLAKRILPLCEKNNITLIFSHHNFKTTPSFSKMEKIVSKSKEIGADIVKIAVKANNKKDLGNLMKFTLENKKKNLVTISLGSIGLISRVVNPFLGSLMTYGYVDKSTAPGQISIFDIISELRFYDSEYNQRLIKRSKPLESI